MITNQYESPPHYATLKQQRLKQIQEDYFPPPDNTKYFFSHPKTEYIPTDFYPPDYDDDFSPHTIFEVRHSIVSNALMVTFVIVGFLLVAILNNKDASREVTYMNLLMSLGFILYGLVKIADRKPKLVVDRNGLYFYKNNLYVAWEYVIATHIRKETNGDDTTYQLITDYIDAATDECKTHAFVLQGYDKTPGEIAMAITYYHTLRAKGRGSTNLNY